MKRLLALWPWLAAATAEPHEPIPRGSYNISAPAFFDCTGPLFDPVWDEFHAAVLEWESLINANQREENLVVVVTSDLRKVGEQVAQLTHDLLEGWFHRLLGERGSQLDKVLRGDAPEESLNGVCYYGLIQALWTRAELILMQPGVGQAPEEAKYELRTAIEVLGRDYRADYLESTRWPVKSLEIEQTLYLGHLARVPPPRRVVNVPTSQSSGAHIWKPSIDFYALPPEPEQAPMDLHIGAFGQHVALLSEPVTMLRGALQEWTVIGHWYLSLCRRQDPVHHYQCRLGCMLIGECVFTEETDSLGRLLLKLVDFAAEGVGDDEVLEEQTTVDKLLDIAATMWEHDLTLRNCALLVCTIPLICSLLRAVSAAPVLGYFSMTHYAKPQPGVGEWGMMHFAEMAKNAKDNAMAVSVPLISELGELQIAVRLPVVQPFGLYAFREQTVNLFPNPFGRMDPNAGQAHTSILVPRSWMVVETSFLKALARFIDTVTPPFPLNFTVVRTRTRWSPDVDVNFSINPPLSGERLTDILSRDDNVFIETKTMLLYRAALSLPQLPHMMTTYELHTMNVPNFIPGRDWLYRLHRQRRYFINTGTFPGPLRPMKPPLFDPNIWATGDSLAHWILLYDRRFATDLPGVFTFGSFPELLELLLYSDFDAIRERMREHNERVFKPTLQWYRTAAIQLLSHAR